MKMSVQLKYHFKHQELGSNLTSFKRYNLLIEYGPGCCQPRKSSVKIKNKLKKKCFLIIFFSKADDFSNCGPIPLVSPIENSSVYKHTERISFFQTHRHAHCTQSSSLKSLKATIQKHSY